MSDARRLYLSKCAGCHREYQRSEYTPAQWAAVVDEMEKQKRVRLTPDDRALILGYLSGDR